MNDETSLPRFLTEDEQRARIRIEALKLEAQLIERIGEGEQGLTDEVEAVQRTLKSVGREPSYTEKVSIEEHHRRLREALAAARKKQQERAG